MACGAILLWEFTWHHSALPVPLYVPLLWEILTSEMANQAFLVL